MSWRTIDSAPRDGTEFLAFGPDLGWQVVDYDPSEKHPDWVWAVMDGATYHRDAFTHWRTLDAPEEMAAARKPGGSGAASHDDHRNSTEQSHNRSSRTSERGAV